VAYSKMACTLASHYSADDVLEKKRAAPLQMETAHDVLRTHITPTPSKAQESSTVGFVFSVTFLA
jgi:hypothetical protein